MCVCRRPGPYAPRPARGDCGTGLGGNPRTNYDEKVRAIKRGAVLVVGHSNTIPELIQTLGGPAGILIGDPEFNHLYLLAGPRFATLTYGE